MASLQNIDNVSYFFEQAIKQYSDINIVFYLDKCEYSRLKTLCVGLKNGHFITRVSLSAVENTPVVWGTEVQGYFLVRDVDTVPCNFRTRLVRIYNAPPDALFLVFPLPKHIDHDQRRFSRRVNLNTESSTEFGVWHGMFVHDDSNLLPQMRWIHLDGGNCDLAEISANGLRLDFAEKSPILAKMAINDEILLQGNFGQNSRADDIYVLGNIVRIMKKMDAEDVVSVGCHFRAWRKSTAVGNAWFRADPREGIGQIAQWLSRNFRSIGK